MSLTPVLETARLRLRGLTLSDFDEYVALWADPEVVRYITGQPSPREATWSRLLGNAGHWDHMGFGYFAMEHRETGRLVGEAGLKDMLRPITPSLEGTMEAGWVLRGDMHGQGLAHGAMVAILDWADCHAPRRRSTAIIDSANVPSLRLAVKLGFTEFARTYYHDTPIIMFERFRPGT